MSIEDQIENNIETIKGIISNLLLTSNSYLGIYGMSLNPNYISAGQTKGEYIGNPTAGIDPDRPVKPQILIPEVAPMGTYSTGFVMPDAGSISDAEKASASLFFNEPVYTEWMLTELKTKIEAGFDNLTIDITTQNGIWARLTQRHTTALLESIDRRTKRWAGRGHDMPSEVLNFRREEAIRLFGYTYTDYERDLRTKTAELKADNRQFSIGAALKGEVMVINQTEEMVMRSLDVAKTVLEFAMKTFEADIGRWTDVRVEEWRNKLYHFTKDLLMKIEKSKADIAKYTTNTRIIADNIKMKGLNFEADTEAYVADAFLNEMKAENNIDINNLRLNEMEENTDLQLKEKAVNREARLKAVSMEVKFTDSMGKVYSTYLNAAMEAITALTSIASDYKKTITTAYTSTAT